MVVVVHSRLLLPQITIQAPCVVQGERFGLPVADRTRHRQRLVKSLKGLLLLPQVGVRSAHAVQGQRLATLLSHVAPHGERLIEIIKGLLLPSHGGVCFSQIVQCVRLAGAAARLLQVRRQRFAQFPESLQLPQVAQHVLPVEHPPPALPTVYVVPDRQRLIQVIQRLFPPTQVVTSPADIGQRAGFRLPNPQVVPNGQRLVEQRQCVVLLAEVAVDPAHGVLRHCLGGLVTRVLFNRQGLVEAIQRLLHLPCLPV